MQTLVKSCRAALAAAAILAAWPLGCTSWGGGDGREIDSAMLAQPPAYAAAALNQDAAAPRQPLVQPATAAPSVPMPSRATQAPAAHKAAPAETIPPAAAAALDRLREGNQRFLGGKHDASHLGPARLQELTAGQKPFAAILCCSDSRVPPELVFDQGLGDVFVIRVAGNVDDPDVTASVEYAAEHLHVPLVVVMGHSQCGAVTAAVEDGKAPGSIGGLVGRIKPAVDKAKAAGATDKARLLVRAIDENIKQTAEDLKKSPVIKELEHAGKVYVTGARYDLETGRVAWFK